MIEITLAVLPSGIVLVDVDKDGPACPMCDEGIIDIVGSNPYVLDGAIIYGKCDDCGRYFRAAHTPQECGVTQIPVFSDDELAAFIEGDIPGVEHFENSTDAKPSVPESGDTTAGPFPS